MRFFSLVFFIVLSLSATAQVNQKLIYGKWKISIISGAGFMLNMDDPGATIHALLEEERKNGELQITEADSLSAATEMQKVFKQFSNVFLEFNKTGKVKFNLAAVATKNEDPVLEGKYEWKTNNSLTITDEKGKEELMTIIELNERKLSIVFIDDEDGEIQFVFKR